MSELAIIGKHNLFVMASPFLIASPDYICAFEKSISTETKCTMKSFYTIAESTIANSDGSETNNSIKNKMLTKYSQNSQ